MERNTRLDRTVAIKVLPPDLASDPVVLTSTVIIFQQPLRSLLDVADVIESRYQLDLVPALVVLCTVLGFHYFSKRHRTKLETQRVIAERTQARTDELTRVLTLAQALTDVSEWSVLEAVLRQQFPLFVGQRDYGVLGRSTST